LALIVPRGADCCPTLHDAAGDLELVCAGLGVEDEEDTVGPEVGEEEDGVAAGFRVPDEHAMRHKQRTRVEPANGRRCTASL